MAASMGELIQIVTPLHRRTQRDYVARMVDEKVACMLKAKEYARDYWDGDRRYGYGGYTYDGRWKPVAQALIDRYQLTDESKVLDVGCGKAHLLFELKQLLPRMTVVGLDVSDHALADAPSEVRDFLSIHRAQDPFPYSENHFDLVISLATLHNLKISELKDALQEIDRVGQQKYVMVESYRNEQEQFNLQCWALTCESFYDAESWKWIFDEFGYSGDFEFIYFE